MRIVVTAALLVLVVGCTPNTRVPDIDPALVAEEARKQRAAVVEARIAQHQRLWDVAFRIAAANTELCGERVRPGFGYQAVTIDRIDEPWREAWRSRLGVTERPTVAVVVRDSPAARAGLRPGDRLLRIGEHDIGAGRGALAAAELPADAGPTEFVVEREGGEHRLTVRPVRLCDYPAVLQYDDRVNAFADGGRVIVTTGMLRFAREDAELALVLGHELAHNTRGHIDSKRANILLGGLVGAALSVLVGIDVSSAGAHAGAGVFSQDFEAEADYVGVYHAARAGYDMRSAASFWRRMAVAHPRAIRLAGSTHPSTVKRFLAIEQAAREVERKRAANAPLTPEER